VQQTVVKGAFIEMKHLATVRYNMAYLRAFESGRGRASFCIKAFNNPGSTNSPSYDPLLIPHK